MKNVVAFTVAGVSAYSFSFAIDLVARRTARHLSIHRLSAGSNMVSYRNDGFIALRLSPTSRFFVIPFVGLALLAFLGGVMGHRYSLLVGAVMLAQAVGVWLATAPFETSMSELFPPPELVSKCILR